MPNYKTVSEVVKNELCLGCGMCEVVCPVQAIKIEYNNKIGYHTPTVDLDKCTNCGLCLQVCSGWNVDHAKLNIGKFGKIPENPFVGNYTELLVGHSEDPDFRNNGASGGIVSQILMNMLDSKTIDAALIITPSKDDFNSPEIIFAKTKAELIKGQGSFYLNAAVGSKLKYLLTNETKIALVGLPCLLNSLQKSFKLLPELHNKILYTIGLFCNGVYSGNSITKFCDRKNIKVEELQKVEFRRGEWPGKMKFTFKDEHEEFYKRDKLFQTEYLKRCYYCYDYLADIADVSVGDNWLPTNRAGSNAIIVRNPAIKQFFNKIDTEALKLSDFMESHRLYHSRRRYTSALLKQGRLHGKVVPQIKPAVNLPTKFWNHAAAWVDWKRSNLSSPKINKFMKIRGTVLDTFVYPKPIPKKFSEETNIKEKYLTILITEGDVVGNKGAVAMTDCLIRDISEKISEAHFVVTSKHIKKDVSYDKNVRTLYDNGPHFELALLAAGLWGFLNIFGINASSLLNNKISKAYLDADLVISATGISFIEEFGNKKIYHFSKYLLMPLILKKKVIKFTQSFGPINSSYNRFMASTLLPRITKVMARGEISRINLSKIGVKANVKTYPDIAITLKKSDSFRIEELKRSLKGCKIIGISPNIVCKNLTAGSLYLDEMKKICDYIISNIPTHDILFIPHTITAKNKGMNDDMWLCNKLADKLPKARTTVIDTEDFTPGELKALIELSDFFVGSRYHSLVAAVSTSTPCMGIGWHYKYDELMNWYKLEQNIINIWDLYENRAVELFKETFNKKDDLKKLLVEVNPDVKSLARQATKEIIMELKR